MTTTTQSPPRWRVILRRRRRRTRCGWTGAAAGLSTSCRRCWRTFPSGLSKYYKGRSQSFTSLSDVKCLQDLAKKTAAHTGSKASRSSISRHFPGPRNRTIAKKTAPRGSSGRVPSRAWSRGLPHRSGKPPAYQSKKELCSRDFC
ncbi:hypothetical protein ACQJBY_069401 [Aegilops geniculata]